jgi:hypothetical protein
MAKITVRKGMPSVQIEKAEFKKRFLARFYDPDYEPLMPELDKVVEAAWITYNDYHKSPRTRKAGKEFADPSHDLPIEWLETRANVQAAELKQKNPKSASRILIVNGSSRNDQTCPGEMSKTWRMVTLAKEAIQKTRGFEVEILDLSRLTAEYGKVIYPCKVASLPPNRCAIGLAVAIPIMRSARPAIGWPRSIRNGWPRTAS